MAMQVRIVVLTVVGRVIKTWDQFEIWCCGGDPVSLLLEKKNGKYISNEKILWFYLYIFKERKWGRNVNFFQIGAIYSDILDFYIIEHINYI